MSLSIVQVYFADSSAGCHRHNQTLTLWLAYTRPIHFDCQGDHWPFYFEKIYQQCEVRSCHLEEVLGYTERKLTVGRSAQPTRWWIDPTYYIGQ